MKCGRVLSSAQPVVPQFDSACEHSKSEEGGGGGGGICQEKEACCNAKRQVILQLLCNELEGAGARSEREIENVAIVDVMRPGSGEHGRGKASNVSALRRGGASIHLRLAD